MARFGPERIASITRGSCSARTSPSRCRRGFLAGAGSLLAARGAFAQGAPAVVTAEKMRPGVPSGVMSGDVSDRRAVLWSRTDRPARMLVELSRDETMKNARRLIGPAA